MDPFRHCKFAVIRGKTSFFVRSAGHYYFAPGEREAIPRVSNFAELFWCMDGKGEFLLNGKMYPLPPGWIWYYPPGSRHVIQAAKTGFHYRWLTLEGPGAQYLFDSLHIKPGASEAGECPEELFSRIDLHIDSTQLKSRMITLTAAFEILTLAVCPPRSTGKSTAERAKQIIDSNFTNPELNADRVAGLLGFHRVSVSRAFSSCYGFSISEYLISCRLKKALELLKDPHIPVSEAAAASGFSDPDYFSKVIRRKTGKTPKDFRCHQPQKN